MNYPSPERDEAARKRTSEEVLKRQKTLNTLWKRIFLISAVLLAVAVVLAELANGYTVPLIVFVTGNIGGYVGFHRQLNTLTDEELENLCDSWFALALPSFMGGILAGLLYVLFISGIVRGDLFPLIAPDDICPWRSWRTFKEIFCQHAEGYASYAKLLFWSFVAGFNQNYVVDLIETIKGERKSKPGHG